MIANVPHDGDGGRTDRRARVLIVVARIERERARVLARAADRVCALILARDCPDTGIEAEIAKVRALCEELYPEKMALFEMIYGARFRRLREQFRSGKTPTV